MNSSTLSDGGLQVLSERAATSVEEFRAQLGEVKQFMQRLNAALPPELSKDSAEIDELLEKSDKEAASEQPSAHRIKRWLQNINDIATQVKTNVKTFTAVSVAVQSLIRAVASLFG